MKKIIDIKDLNLKESPIVRAEIREDVVLEYAALLKAKQPMPPPTIYSVNGGKADGALLIADGWHRIEAAKRNGLKSIVVDVTTGTKQDCLKAALCANTAHGIRRSNADKYRCVQLALDEWPKLSSRELSSVCAVSHTFVDEVRKQLAAVASSGPKEETRTGADGKARKVVMKAKKKKAKAALTKLDKDEAEPAAVKAAPTVDRTGFAIPVNVMPLFLRESEALQVVSVVKSVLEVLTEVEKDKDALYGEVNFNACYADLKDVISNLKNVVPYAVCPACSGKANTKCMMCRGRGCISEFKWKTVVPDELKAMRTQMTKK